jgi:predicted acylesterase/phospholipase RssA
MWGTSAGSVSICVAALQLEWDTVCTYIIRRPWEHVFQTNLVSLMNAYHNLGMYSIHEMEKLMAPLFLAKDMTIHTTMQEFYDKTQIEVHIFTSEMNSMSCVDISYKTHPSWRVIDAIYASSCLPGLFSPLFVGEEVYIDGFLYCDYPLAKCLEATGAHKEEVFGICKRSMKQSTAITKESNMIEYLGKIVYMTLKEVFHTQRTATIPYEVIVEGNPSTAEDFKLVITQQSNRQELLEYGKTVWSKYSEVFKELKMSTSNI